MEKINRKKRNAIIQNDVEVAQQNDQPHPMNESNDQLLFLEMKKKKQINCTNNESMIIQQKEKKKHNTKKN